MTVTTEVSRATFPWTGAETSFACGFPADDVSHLRVFFRTNAGVTTQMTLGVNYNATLASGSKLATVTPVSFPASSGTVIVRRLTPAQVAEVLADGQEYSLAVIQALHDKAAMRSAEDRSTLSRAIVLEEGVELGEGNFDLGGSGISNAAPGQAASDLATVAQIQAILAGSGNVPAPVLGDVDRLLVATGADAFAWLALALSHLPDGLFTADAAGLAKFANGFLTADAAGRAKMADGFLSADAGGRAKMANGFFSADATGRAKMADGFVSTAKAADGLLSADVAGRAKMADGFTTVAKLDASGQQGLVKAWLSLNGTGTIATRDSFNVSSVTDNATGDYTMTFATPMPNANYSTSGNATAPGAQLGSLNAPGTVSANQDVAYLRSLSGNSTIGAFDASFFSAQIVGDPA